MHQDTVHFESELNILLVDYYIAQKKTALKRAVLYQ